MLVLGMIIDLCLIFLMFFLIFFGRKRWVRIRNKILILDYLILLFFDNCLLIVLLKREKYKYYIVSILDNMGKWWIYVFVFFVFNLVE